MRQYTNEDITVAVEGMVAEGMVDKALAGKILKHFQEYMQARGTETLRHTIACALLLEAFQTYDV